MSQKHYKYKKKQGHDDGYANALLFIFVLRVKAMHTMEDTLLWHTEYDMIHTAQILFDGRNYECLNEKYIFPKSIPSNAELEHVFFFFF